MSLFNVPPSLSLILYHSTRVTLHQNKNIKTDYSIQLIECQSEILSSRDIEDIITFNRLEVEKRGELFELDRTG